MSNLKSARQAIKAELEHARKGAAFYQSRVEALEEALATIEGVEAVNEKTSAVSTKAAKSNTSAARAKPGRKARKQAAAGNGAKLPSTGKDFWPNLITAQPQSAKEILDAAIRSLGIAPSKDQLKKLAQRQTSALHNLVKAHAIGDSGAGRERRFFRKQ
ncbi:MAG: hypothetical protein V7642_5191 [Burkholderiales bacterium]|jgi:hypothetical protein